jgi:hypothetical protein
MALGFLPIIIAIFLSRWLSQEAALVTGFTFGVSYICLTLFTKYHIVLRPLLYISTGVLAIFSAVALFSKTNFSHEYLPFLLELSLLIPAFALYINRKLFFDCSCYLRNPRVRVFFGASGQATIVSIRITLILVFLQFIGMFIALTFFSPLPTTVHNNLFSFIPLLVLICAILMNQYSISIFNKLFHDKLFFPIVNVKGDVTGKAFARDAISQKNNYINPVVRVAITCNHKLLLRTRRPQPFDSGKTDIPLESYLFYGETLEQAISRMVRCAFPDVPIQEHLQFIKKYHFENTVTNRLNYLFVLPVADEKLLEKKATDAQPQQKECCCASGEAPQLWTLEQVEENLGKDLFGTCFEEEFEGLKKSIEEK